MYSLLLIVCCIVSTGAFTVHHSGPVPLTKASLKFRQVRFMSMDAEGEAARLREKARKLKEEVAELSGTTVEEMEAEESSEKSNEISISKSGDFYDDEVEAYRDPLSDNMRARLMKEASTGLDSNQKQTNVIFYICIGVAILVALGGSGILY